MYLFETMRKPLPEPTKFMNNDAIHENRIMFRDIRTSLLVLASLFVSISPLYAWESENEHLATLRRDDASFYEKSTACKRLAVVGTEAAVPVLAGLLQDDKLSHLARYGLEPIPSPKVDKAFLAALATLKGKSLVGVINSIANRGKIEALEPLSKLMTADDKKVAAAAAYAIARLGTPKAAEILDKSMSGQFAAACLACGKTLAAQGSKIEAVRLLSKLTKFTEAAEHIRLAAMLQVLVIQGADGRERLASAFQSDDRDMFNMALRAARLMPEKVALSTAVKVIDDASPARTVLLLTLLGDLGAPGGLSAVMQALQSDHAAVRIASLRALAKLGNADHVELLVDTAIDSPAEIAEQVHNTLAKLHGRKVDQAVLDLLDDSARRRIVIRVIGQRRIAAAVPKLLALMNGPNQLDVVAALGETVSLDELDVLAKLIDADSPKLREAAQRAIHAACNRLPSRDATAVALSKHLTDETAEFVMNELRLLGGDKALEIVSDAVEGKDPVLKDYASRALGGWLDVSAAAALLKLAKADGDGKFGIRGIKGYIRLARQFSMSKDKRMAMCRSALESASRKTEKLLVLRVLEQYPSVEALRITIDASKKFAKNSELRKEAVRIAHAIALSELIGQQQANAQDSRSTPPPDVMPTVRPQDGHSQRNRWLMTGLVLLVLLVSVGFIGRGSRRLRRDGRRAVTFGKRGVQSSERGTDHK